MEEEDLRSILEDVKGEPCGLEGLGQGLSAVVADGGIQTTKQGHGEGADRKLRERLKKLYKISEEELAINSLEDCVVMRMAVKDH